MNSTVSKNTNNKLVGKVPSVSHAIAILRFLNTASEAHGVNAIAREMALSPSTCFNLLKTLQLEELIDFDQASKKYSLGLGLTEFTRSAGRRSDVIISAKGLMDSLSDQYNISCGLWRVTASDRLVLVAITESDASTRIHSEIGQRQPLLGGVAGKAYAASNALSRNHYKEQFKSIRWQNTYTLKRYVDDIEQAKLRGWAFDDAYYIRGISSVGAVVNDAEGETTFCLTASMFSGQYQAKEIEKIGADVLMSAQKISRSVYGG